MQKALEAHKPADEPKLALTSTADGRVHARYGAENDAKPAASDVVKTDLKKAETEAQPAPKPVAQAGSQPAV
jgi:hypothetical protein